MKLKKDLELVTFLKDVKQCQADVWLITQKEDRLNLKSFLTQCILVAMPDKKNVLNHSRLECDHRDREKLEKWCLL